MTLADRVVSTSYPGWDVPGWSLTPDRVRRMWIAECSVGGLLIRVEAESPAALRILVEARRGSVVTVP